MANGSGTKLDTLYWELEIRAARIEAAEAEARAAGQKIGEQIDKGVQEASTGQQGASKWVDSLISDFRERREDIKREAVAGLITPEEAAAAGRQAAAQFSKELRGGLHALREQGAIQTSDFTPQLAKGADALRLSRQEAERLATQVNTTASVYDKLSRSVYASAYAMDAARTSQLQPATSLYDKLSRSVYEQAYAMDAARGSTVKHGEATKLAIPGLGRLGNAFEGVIQRATETNPVISKLSTTLLQMGVGGLVTTGVLGGVALIVLAYQKLTEGARKVREEADKAADSIDKMLRQKALGAGAELKEQVAALNKQIAADDKALADARSAAEKQKVSPFREGEARVAEITAENARLVKSRAGALAEITRLEREAGAQVQQTRERDLANLISNKNASAAQRAEALRLFTAYSQQLERVQKGTAGPDPIPGRDQLARAAALSEQIKTLGASLFPKEDKTGERKNERVQGLIDQLATLKASLTDVAADDTFARLTEIDHKIKNIKPLPEQMAQLTALRNEIAQLLNEKNAAKADELSRQVRDIAAASTITAVDDLENALKDLLTTLEKRGASTALLDEVKALQEPMIAVTKASEDLQVALDKIRDDTAAGVNVRQNLQAIQPLIDAAIEQRNALEKSAPGSQALAKAQKTLNDLLAEEVRLRERLGQIKKEELAHVESTRDKTAALAGNIAAAANAAFGLASAFLGVDSNITKALGSIGQLAGGIEAIANATSVGGFLAGAGQAIGGALALGNAIFGDSPAELARRERLKENTDALKKLTERVGTLSQIGATGSQITDIIAALRSMGVTETDTGTLSDLSGHGFRPRLTQLEAALKSVGLSVGEFEDIMKGLGVEFDLAHLTAEDLALALKEVNKAALVQFGTSYAGQMEEFNAALEFFPDLSDPIKQFERFKQALDKIKDGGGVLSEVLRDFDLTTAEGVAAAIAAIQELFTQFEAGALTAEQLGGLSPAEFLDALLKSLELVRNAGAGGPAGTGGFNVDRTITEVTGSRIGALLSTANVFAEMTAANTAKIAEQLSGADTSDTTPGTPAPEPGGAGAVSPSVNLPPDPLDRLFDAFDLLTEKSKADNAALLERLIGAPSPLITPPSISASGSSAIGGVTFNGGITVVVQVPAGEPDPEDYGKKVGRGFVQGVSEGQANLLSWRKRAVGNASRGTV